MRRRGLQSRNTPHRSPGNTWGFTLLEMALLLAVIGAVGGAFLATNRTLPGRDAERDARIFAQRLEAALASAEAGDDTLILRVRAAPTDAYLTSVSRVDAGGSPWASLSDGVRWGGGEAVVSPLGHTVEQDAFWTGVRCRERRCTVPAGGGAVYYLSSRLDPTAVFAVLLTSRASVLTYRYRPASRAWTPLSR